VVSLDPEDFRAESVWPGGASAVPGNRYYLNLLPLWLRNETVPLLFRRGDVVENAASIMRFSP
jgi:penicillin amidase